MKKLNRKGFTLVELLAVIIILAIVVGITIPAVLTMVDNARERAGHDAAAVVADWVDQQYGTIYLGIGDADAAFTSASACGTSASNCTQTGGKDITDSSFIVNAGLKPADIEKINVEINSTTGRSCVTVHAASGGNFYVTSGGKDNNTYEEGVCE